MSAKQAIFLMWVSGSGKGTVMQKLLDSFPSLHYVQSYTTRDLRPWETNGEKYWHITKEEFEQGIADNEFLEYARVHNQDFYGTKFADIDTIIQAWKNPIKEVDIDWYKQILDDDRVYSYTKSIFLTISDEVIRERILLRDPNTPEDDIQNRITSAQKERLYAQEYCNIIVNASQDLPRVQHDVIQALYSLWLDDEKD